MIQQRIIQVFEYRLRTAIKFYQKRSKSSKCKLQQIVFSICCVPYESCQNKWWSLGNIRNKKTLFLVGAPSHLESFPEVHDDDSDE